MGQWSVYLTAFTFVKRLRNLCYVIVGVLLGGYK